MRGHGGGHAWRGGRGRQRGRIVRLIEPALLALLAEGPRHGYDLIASMGQFELGVDALDSGLIYRMLREMEESGWVTSVWEAPGPGPARRVYSLTGIGREAIAAWRQELGRTHDTLHRLLDLTAER